MTSMLLIHTILRITRQLHIFQTQNFRTVHQMLVVHNPTMLLLTILRKYRLQSVFHKHPMRFAGHVACMGDRRRIFRFMVQKPEGKSPLGKTQS